MVGLKDDWVMVVAVDVSAASGAETAFTTVTARLARFGTPDPFRQAGSTPKLLPTRATQSNAAYIRLLRQTYLGILPFTRNLESSHVL